MSSHSVLGDLLLRWEELAATGQEPSVEEMCRDHPELVPALRQRIEVMKRWIAARDVNEIPADRREEEAPPFPAVPGYEVLEEVGRGGMGVVYKARQVKLNRLVALKMMRSGALAGAAERQRFLAEAEAVARLAHAGVVEIHDFGTYAGLPFLALEFCGGGSLAGRLVGGPLPVRESAQLVEKLCRSMQAVHEAGIVHRDLKPANVLFTERGGGQNCRFWYRQRSR